MTARLRLLGTTLVLGLVLPLVGCGQDAIDEYCAALRADQKEIAEMIESPSPTSLLICRRPFVKRRDDPARRELPIGSGSRARDRRLSRRAHHHPGLAWRFGFADPNETV